MRIKGPGDGPRPAGSVDEAREVDAPESIGESAPANTSAVGRVGDTGGPTGTDAIAQVAARLRAGEITADQAVELLIDDAVARHAGGRAELEPKLREVLRDYAASDPFLSSKIRKLTQTK